MILTTVTMDRQKIITRLRIRVLLLVTLLYVAWILMPERQAEDVQMSSFGSIPKLQAAPFGSQWLNPKEGDTNTVGALTFVWLNSWWTCEFVRADYSYRPVGFLDANPQDVLDISRWRNLTIEQRQKVFSWCND